MSEEREQPAASRTSQIFPTSLEARLSCNGTLCTIAESVIAVFLSTLRSQNAMRMLSFLPSSGLSRPAVRKDSKTAAKTIRFDRPDDVELFAAKPAKRQPYLIQDLPANVTDQGTFGSKSQCIVRHRGNDGSDADTPIT